MDVKVVYYVQYPNENNPKYPLRRRFTEHRVLNEIPIGEVTPAFQIGNDVILRHGCHLYTPVHLNFKSCYPSDSVEKFAAMCQSGNILHDRSASKEAFEERIDYLFHSRYLIDGRIYKRRGEPYYVIRIAEKQGITVDVGNRFRPEDEFFPAYIHDQKDAAWEHAKRICEVIFGECHSPQYGPMGEIVVLSHKEERGRYV